MRLALPILLCSLITALSQPFSLSDASWLQSSSRLRNTLVGYWTLDEASGTRYDHSKNGNNLSSSNTVGSATGVIGNCATFTAASTQFLTIPNNSSINVCTKSFEGSCFVKLTTKSATQAIVGQYENSGGKSWLIDYDSSSDRFVFVYSTDGATTLTLAANNFGAPSTNVWYYLSWVHDASANVIAIGVNNGTYNTASIGANLFNSTAAFIVGAISNGGTMIIPLNGSVDELGLWNRIFNSTDRAKRYNASLGTRFPAFTDSLYSSNPIVHWPGIPLTGNYTLANSSSNVVMAPDSSSATIANIPSHKFNHVTRICTNAVGKICIAWSSGGTNEDAGGQMVAMAWSTNKGVAWSSPTAVVPAQSLTYGASYAAGARFCSPILFTTLSNSVYLLSAISEGNGTTGDLKALCGAQINDDGSTGTPFLITTNTYTAQGGVTQINYDSNLGPPLLYLAKLWVSSDVIGNDFAFSITQSTVGYGEASTVSTDGGTQFLIRIYRRLTGTTTLNYLSCSYDGAISFDPIRVTEAPNSPSQTIIFRVSDGRYAMIGNPQDNGTIRDPLYLAMLSRYYLVADSVTAIRQGVSGTPTYAGTGKGGGADYPDVIQVGNYLYVGYSTQKETMWFSRVLIPGFQDSNND